MNGNFPINVAVIGCGRIAGHHCRAIRATNGLKLVAVCDLEIEKAKNYGLEHNVQYYDDYRVMLKQERVGLVVIATPSGMHFEHAMEIIESFGKDLVIEKPTVLRHTQLAEVFKLAKIRGTEIFPVFQNRYNKAVQRVKAALSNGELGSLVSAAVRVRWCRPQRYYDLSPWRGTFAMDGGALTNQGIHHVDLLRFLGGEVTRISAVMKTLGAKIEVEDTVAATLEFANGYIGTLEITTAARPVDFEASLSFVGSKGLAQLGGIAVNELQVLSVEPEACSLSTEDFSNCVYGHGHFELYRDIYNVKQGIIAHPVSEQDCLSTLRLLHAFYVSAEEKRWVAIEEGAESKRLGKFDASLAKLYRTPIGRS